MLWKNGAAVERPTAMTPKASVQELEETAILRLQYAATKRETIQALSDPHLPDAERTAYIPSADAEIADAAVSSLQENHQRIAVLLSSTLSDALKVTALRSYRPDYDDYYEIGERVLANAVPEVRHSGMERYVLKPARPFSLDVLVEATRTLDPSSYVRQQVYGHFTDEPRLRAAAVEATTDHIFRMRAMKDGSVRVRIAALSGITSPATRALIAANDPSEAVRTAARQSAPTSARVLS